MRGGLDIVRVSELGAPALREKPAIVEAGPDMLRPLHGALALVVPEGERGIDGDGALRGPGAQAEIGVLVMAIDEILVEQPDLAPEAAVEEHQGAGDGRHAPLLL